MPEIICEDLNKNIDFFLDKIVDLLETQIANFGETELFVAEKIDSLHQKKAEFEANKSKVREIIDEAKARCDTAAKIYVSKKHEAVKLKTEFKNLDDKHKILVNEYENLEEKCLELKSKLSISSQDKLTLELDKKKLDLYGMATNIVWDYSVPINSTISGCVRNKTKNYLQTFVFENDETSAKEVQEKLWDEIGKGLLDNCTENNENVPINA